MHLDRVTISKLHLTQAQPATGLYGHNSKPLEISLNLAWRPLMIMSTFKVFESRGMVVFQRAPSVVPITSSRW